MLLDSMSAAGKTLGGAWEEGVFRFTPLGAPRSRARPLQQGRSPRGRPVTREAWGGGGRGRGQGGVGTSFSGTAAQAGTVTPRTDHGRSCTGTGGFAAPRWGAGERRGEAHFREDHSPAARPAWRYSSGARVPL